eukprot:g12539.t1 g12539   contig6:2118851-2120018(-)
MPPPPPNKYAKRSLRVIDAESDDGSTEYKRQVHKLSTSRLRTLATQMSYRLDQGMGRCTYHVGVEDDGCHSVMDYQAVSESAWVLESIARSLNAVVLERKMIQNEIEMDEDGEIRLLEGGDVVVVDEPPVLGKTTSKGLGYNDDEEDSDDAEDEKEEKTSSIDGDSKKDGVKLSTAEGSFTRCELTIQRVETHLLDPSPLGLSALSRASSFGEGVDGALAATSLQKLSKLDLSSHKEESKSCIEKENLPNANPSLIR